MTTIVLLLTLALAPPQTATPIDSRTASPVESLARAKTLYAAAAYEDALTHLATLASANGDVDSAEIDLYRALCLLALNRSGEAERALERILTRKPRYVLDESEAPPRLVMLFKSVRARMLPGTARALYTEARQKYDLHQYDAAAADLRDVLLLIGAEDQQTSGAFGDLRVLAEGFLRLAEARAGDIPPAVSPEPRSAAPESPRTWDAAAIVYSVIHPDVIAPVEISRPLPSWSAPTKDERRVYQGVIEVVIDETGRVESAVIRRSIAPAYDALLITAATESWRFQPASRLGQPVKYRRLFEVILHQR